MPTPRENLQVTFRLARAVCAAQGSATVLQPVTSHKSHNFDSQSRYTVS
jgi:hypothetical protein